MQVVPGHTYYRKANFHATVKKVTKVDDGIVHFEVVYGSHQIMRRSRSGTQPLNRFCQWATGELPADYDFHRLDGAKINPTYILHDSVGNQLVRASERQIGRWQKMGFDIIAEDRQYRLRDHETEKRLRALWHQQPDQNRYFLSIRNEKCCVCGKDYGLTRHHVLPQRHKQKLPQWIKKWLSNVLFTCWDCHLAYETQCGTEPVAYNPDDPEGYVQAWEAHFRKTMQPKFIPEGWHLCWSDVAPNPFKPGCKP